MSPRPRFFMQVNGGQGGEQTQTLISTYVFEKYSREINNISKRHPKIAPIDLDEKKIPALCVTCFPSTNNQSKLNYRQTGEGAPS